MDDVTQQQGVSDQQKEAEATGAGTAAAAETIGSHKGYTLDTGAADSGLSKLRDAAATEMPKAAVVSLAQHDQLKGRVAWIESAVDNVTEKQTDQTAANEQMQKEHESLKAAIADKFKAFEALLHRHGIREQTEAEPTDQ